MVPERTCQIVAYNMPHFPMDIAVDWAYEMLLLGYDTPNLVILAGIDKSSARWYDTADYLKATLDELHLNQLARDEMYISYGSYYVKKIAAGQNVKTNVGRLYHEVGSSQMFDLFADFFDLWDVWQDFEAG